MCNPVTTAYPDKLLAKGIADGFEWEVTGSPFGFRCGYVRIPPGHPWHGQGIYGIDAAVHGGLTFAEADTDCGKGGEDNAWWLGFDCAHAGDAPDPELPGYSPRLSSLASYGTVKSTAYVRDECLALIAQAAAASAH